jgi:hypothetical protein
MTILFLKHIYRREVGVILFLQATVVHLKPEEGTEETGERGRHYILIGGQKYFLPMKASRQWPVVLVIKYLCTFEIG